MPRAPAPNWRRVLAPDLTEHVRESQRQVNHVCNELGHYAELIYTGIETRDRAERIKKNLFNAAKRLGVSMTATIEREGNGYRVRYKAIDKVAAKAYILEHYGEDPSKWPYSPHPGRSNYSTETAKEES